MAADSHENKEEIMRILIGGFVAECNAYVDRPMRLEDFAVTRGDAVADILYVRELAKTLGVELVPSLMAYGGGGGRLDKDAFDYILTQFKKEVKKHLHEIDGMFFFFHGASSVIDLDGDSGDHELVREIRKITGPYMPLAMVMDPHGNLSQEQADHCNIIRTFRHSPHTDRKEAHQIVFRALVDYLANRREIHPVYKKVPILLGGERCVSTDEPLVSINGLLDEIEADPRILCCSYHIGYLRHDSAKCGAAIIVVPYNPENESYARQKAQEIYDFVWARHRDFHFTGYADEPEQALQAMMDTKGGPVFLTDSGDNVTAGAQGMNTYVLRQLLALKDFRDKNILVAGIQDKGLYDKVLSQKKSGDRVSFEIGAAKSELSAKTAVSGEILSFGELHHHYHNEAVVGVCCSVRLDDVPVTLVVEDFPVSFAEKYQYDCANIDMEAYNFFVVKQGYLYPELKARAKRYVMSLTDGTTMQRTERLNYKTVRRPVWPLDDI